MIFVEFRFFVFFATVFTVYWLLASNTKRKVWLLVTSYFFYGSWDWRFLSFIMGSTLLDYYLGLAIANAQSGARKRSFITLSVVVNLGILGVFKYFNFFADTFTAFARAWGLNVGHVALNIVLPVGVSFYTFQSLSYTIDLYRGLISPAKSLLDFAVAVSFFPHLVAGPIMRARDYLSQLDEPRRFATVDVRWALVLFLIGFFKKACVADNVALLVDRYFSAPGGHGAGSAWLAVVGYAFQIYGDFSGYTDMGIAAAALLGYRLTINFDAPYLSTNIGAFWRRWHISLSSWLRDYLYIPLGGNRKGSAKANRNLMITMLLGGLWHGASWNFVLWGFLHGLALTAHRTWTSGKKEVAGPPSPVQATVLCALTFGWVCLTWVPFRARDFASTGVVLSEMFGFGGASEGPLLDGRTSFAVWTAMGVLALCHLAAHRGYLSEWWRRIPRRVFIVGYAASWSVLIAMKPVGYVPFIYFQF